MNAPDTKVRDLRDPNARRATLRVVNQIGMEMLVEVSSIDDAYAAMRQFGARGWSSGEAPRGGYTLPYAMHDTFDWSLIGAKHVTFRDGGGEGIYYRGDLYSRRDYPEEKKHGKTAPAKVKYSRGGQPTDDPTICEGKNDTIKFGYVTLISFVGNGRPISSLCLPSGAERKVLPAAQTHEVKPPETFVPEGRDVAPSDRDRAQIRTEALARNIALDSDQMCELVRTCTSGETTDLTLISQQQAYLLIGYLRTLPLPKSEPQTGQGAREAAAVAQEPARTAETPAAGPIGGKTLLNDNVVKNVEIALERAGITGDALSTLVGEISTEIDGELTYEIRRLSMGAVQALLNAAKRGRNG